LPCAEGITNCGHRANVRRITKEMKAPMTQTNQRVHGPAGETYTVVAGNLELPPGTRFNVEPGPVEAGQLAMIAIGTRPTLGRHYPAIAGADWIVQPGLLIQVAGKTPVRVVGPALPCPLFA
jgi:hypothetical protein